MPVSRPWSLPLRRVCWLVVSLAVVAGAGCERTAPRLDEFSGPIMGTRYSVKVVDVPPDTDVEGLAGEVLATLERINAAMSTYLPESELSRFNTGRSDDWFAVSSETAHVVQAALDLSAATDGAFDPTVGPLVDLWGFGPTLTAGALPDDAAIAAAQARVGWRHLSVRLDPPALRKALPDLAVDLSAIAKGYAVDEVAALLEGAGVVDYLVDVGGELRVRGHNANDRPWGVAIEQPRPGGRAVQRVVRLSSGAVATSGDYRNYYEIDGRRYSHEIDPATGRPVRHALASVTVLAATAMNADALATAYMVLGPEATLQRADRDGVAALLLVRDGDGFREVESAHFGAWTGER